MTTAELILVPLPGMGHLNPIVQTAKLLLKHDERISATVLIMNLPFFVVDSQINFLEAETSSIKDRFKLIKLPALQKPIEEHSRALLRQLMEDYRPIIKQFVEEQVIRRRLAGIVVDAFCAYMADVAEDLNVPFYFFYPSTASMLCLTMHLRSLDDDHGLDVAKECQDLDKKLQVSGFKNPVPTKVLPSLLASEDGWALVLDQARRYSKSKGILMNTLTELESEAIQSLQNNSDLPRIYPVGPIVNLGKQEEKDPIINWLDEQPESSVVFLCFGSMGNLFEEQVREAARGVERCGYRFLWSLRRPPTADEKVGPPRAYESLEEVLPEGFLDRTAEIGKIIGWAPQTAVLSHRAIGCFVSHCGWNSVLESLWFGVPVAAWPMYAEQQLNAFLMVEELKLAVEIRMDYRWDHLAKISNGLVEAEVIEKGIRRCMEGESDELKKISEVSRQSQLEGGSSYLWLHRFIEDVLANAPTVVYDRG